MAPGKDKKKNSERYVKELFLSKHCQKSLVPSGYIGLHSCERNFGMKYQVLHRVIYSELCFIRCQEAESM